MSMDDAFNTFIAESRDLLQQMEDALLRLEQADDDPETINAIFRAAHTIKGSAGLFGLDHVVKFTHAAESVLDRVRGGALSIDGELAALLLESCDHIGILVDQVAEGSEADASVQELGDVLAQRLGGYMGDSPAELPDDVTSGPANAPAGTSGGGVIAGHWHISLRFSPDAIRNGMDPASFLRYLSGLGRIVRIVTLTDRIPAAEEMDPECCYLGFEIALESQEDQDKIESVFEFVREDCVLHILPPHSSVDEYAALLGELPEEAAQIGEVLVRCGTLTPAELEGVLAAGADEEPLPPPAVDLPPAAAVPASTGATRSQPGGQGRAGEAGFIRVDAGKLDQLINLVGELIIAAAGANLSAKNSGVTEMIEDTANVSLLVEEVRDSALNLRMVQIGATFSRFNRVVRDVSKELGKDIRLQISGAETELDKTVVEKIGDPLTHLVRNSMDHGIEAAETRIARGKPAHGTMSLHAYHESGSIVIEVADDGGGLDRDRILQKAIERGLVKPDQQLSDNEIYNLIFEPGFSTADAVSNLSGRGVGMDVVRRNIQALRGSVDLESVPGCGTTVRVRLPLTLAIIDGFQVGVGDWAYVVPLDMVVECLELTKQEQESASGNCINLRGEVLPYVRLRDQFAVSGGPGQRESIVVVSYAGTKVGLVVDRLIGESQVVIKPLGKLFDRVRGIGGFSILGSGEVALIMDVGGLVRQLTGGGVEAPGQLTAVG
jgi:two-component system chemotaxis sensor kinase CheA